MKLFACQHVMWKLTNRQWTVNKQMYYLIINLIESWNQKEIM